MLNSGNKLYKQAKKIIPGGVQLLSKKPEIFLPDLWPSYYKKANGSIVIDLDGKKYYDFTNCSVGMCPLGYANKKINNDIIKTIKDGNISTLNSYKEIECAKKLLRLHPWFDMARFTKSGGEAMSVAVRIARTYSKKDNILFCGYHGWHDWYISANINNKSNLNKHLLPGVSSLGVPKYLKNSSIAFEFNNTKDFLKKFRKNKNHLAAVILEPTRSFLPNEEFLKEIRFQCTKFNIPLIFDEITVGWRVACGGFHKKLKYKPDIAVFSKATSNGYPLGAILGTKKIMDSAQDTFISSAYWTENIGFQAAISMIDFYKKKNVHKILIKKGLKIKKIWLDISKKHKIKISISGLDPLPVFSFEYKNNDDMMTFFTQEMLKKNFLANGSCFVMISHTNYMINLYKKNLDHVFLKISKILKKDNANFKKYLKGRVKFAKFRNPV
ncbi:aminotransferase class III-fold pyridoxal phosphate-dependent enzyme [Candidatus Pelagibacter sp.]|uniref:aminotransferase class III-fold pyridoxal phosphate-dependent enzyme n=1 Tax=Candidatus Pelagibacter sp. TaxID=2024849 RepID=UPI003F82D431